MNNGCNRKPPCASVWRKARGQAWPAASSWRAKAGLAANPVADRHSLVTRLYLDLTGLPPTAAEARDFVQTNDPEVYPKTVERLLASKAYAEAWTLAFAKDLAIANPGLGSYEIRPMRLFKDSKLATV